MFTGIIEELGKINKISKKDNDLIINVKCSKVLEDTKLGDSIAVNGVCLTAINIGSDFFEANVSYETVSKSSLSILKVGDVVNLERALTLNTRLGGHIVQGHVDGVGNILSIKKFGDSYKLIVSFPKDLENYIVKKGSISIDGISLTVADITNNSFEIAVIPHTFENTNLKHKKSSDIVNIETDIIGRYVEQMVKSSDKDEKLKNLISTFKRK